MLLSLLESRLPCNNCCHTLNARPGAESYVGRMAYTRHCHEQEANTLLVISSVYDDTTQREALRFVNGEGPGAATGG